MYHTATKGVFVHLTNLLKKYRALFIHVASECSRLAWNLLTDFELDLVLSWPTRRLVSSPLLSDEDNEQDIDNKDIQSLPSGWISDSGLVNQLSETSWQPTVLIS